MFDKLTAVEARYEQMFTDWARRAPEQIGVRLGFNDALAHQIQAGSDMLLMPRFLI